MLAADAGAELGFSIDLRGETGQEVVDVWSGDFFLNTFFLTTDWERYSIPEFADPSAQPKDIRVEFSNDFYDPGAGVDRNVYIGSAFLNGETLDPNSENAFSTGTWLAEDGVAPGLGRGSVLNANGYLQFAPPDGSKLTVYAKGEEGQEQFTVNAGTRDFEAVTVTTELKAYEFFLNEPLDPGSVRINFVNDVYDPVNGVDNNLTVDRIEIDGSVYEAEGADVLHAGFYSAEVGLATGFFFTETIHANGSFTFDARTIDGQRYAFDEDVSQDGLIDLAQGNFASATSLSDGSFVGISQGFGFGATSPRPLIVEVFDADGNADSTFNGGSGLDIAPASASSVGFQETFVSIKDVLSDSQNRIVVVADVLGLDEGEFARESIAIRLTRTGEFDASFGNGGIASLGTDLLKGFAVDSLDRLVAVSETTILRLDNVGQLEGSFGVGGILSYTKPAADANFEDVVIRDDRSFAILLNRNFGISGDNGYVLQFNEDGSTGTWYGDNGIATVPRQFFSSSSRVFENYRDFALDNEGRLVLRSQRSLLRLNIGGQVDSTFGGHGVTKFPQSILSDAVLFSFGTESGPIVDPQGRIIVGLDGGFARVNDAGEFDTTFSFDGFAPAPDVNIDSFDVSDLQIDAFGRLFSPIRTAVGGPKIGVWELV